MPLLHAADIRKRFGSTPALRGASLEVEEGEIHALLGENGAGKTTFMNILYGLLTPDAGEIELDGRPYRPASPEEAMRSGVGMVHQHFMLVPTLTVLENLLLGESPFAGFRWEREYDRMENRLSDFSFHIPLEKKVGDLSVGERQRVEIFKALSKGARFLILDEPTAVLAPQEIENLFELLKDLRAQGRSILFISHKLEEIRDLCDRVTLLRRGETVGTFSVSGMNREELARLLLGREFTPFSRNTASTLQDGDPFRVSPRPGGAGKLKGNWICEIAPGKITAVAGVEGNGQKELAEGILGLSETDLLDVRLGETPLPNDPFQRIEAGVGYISEDRQHTGLVMDFSVLENLALKDIARPPWSSRGLLNLRRMRETAQELTERFGVEPPEPDRTVSDLSGGNQQKVVAAREISRPHRLLTAFNPTRGLDIGACEKVQQALLEDARSGAAILLISTELEEAVALADRLYVIFQGELTEIPREDWDHETIGLAMLGSRDGGTA